jgi:hypothetical protein
LRPRTNLEVKMGDYECTLPNGQPFSSVEHYVDKRWAMTTIRDLQATVAHQQEALEKAREALGGYVILGNGKCSIGMPTVVAGINALAAIDAIGEKP